MKKKDQLHIEMRDYVGILMSRGLFAEDISEIIGLKIGTRYTKYSTKWYIYCAIAKKNQKKAIEKHPHLYSRAGKIAQQKHPWLGHELGKKYAQMIGRRRVAQLREEGKLKEQMSFMAKRLQELQPNRSRLNMKKAHETMIRKGTFHRHQQEAALKCMEKNPHQLKEMSKIAHEKYPLALLALESHRRNYPYEFMGSLFDSNDERKLCELFVQEKLMDVPVEGKNIHYRIGRFHIDFFLNGKVFVEYHPPRKYGRKIETLQTYYEERRKLLDESGYESFPLIVFDRLRDAHVKIEEIRKLL